MFSISVRRSQIKRSPIAPEGLRDASRILLILADGPPNSTDGRRTLWRFAPLPTPMATPHGTKKEQAARRRSVGYGDGDRIRPAAPPRGGAWRSGCRFSTQVVQTVRAAGHLDLAVTVQRHVHHVTAKRGAAGAPASLLCDRSGDESARMPANWNRVSHQYYSRNPRAREKNLTGCKTAAEKRTPRTNSRKSRSVVSTAAPQRKIALGGRERSRIT